MVTVEPAFDLDDLVPLGDATGEADGVHRGLGPGVGRAPHRQPVAIGEQLAHLGVEHARRDVQRAVIELGFDRAPHRRVHVSGEQRAEAHVVVDVLVVVDVDHPRARRVAHDDGVRLVRLEARRDSRWHHLAGASGGRLRGARALPVEAHLTFGDRHGVGGQCVTCYGIRCTHGPILAISFVVAYRINASRRPVARPESSINGASDPSLPIAEPVGILTSSNASRARIPTMGSPPRRPSRWWGYPPGVAECPIPMVGVAQLVRASGCGPEGRGFNSRRSPHASWQFGGHHVAPYTARASRL